MLESTPLYGGNADYLEGLYEQYLSDPVSVPAQWRTYFDGLGPRPAAERARGQVIAGIVARATQPPVPAAAASGDGSNGAKQGAVSRLIQVYANRGHLIANLDPLGLQERAKPYVLDLEYFGLSDADLDTEFFTGSRNDAIPKRATLQGYSRGPEVHLHATPSARSSRTCRTPTSACGCRTVSRWRACSIASASMRRRTFCGN